MGELTSKDIDERVEKIIREIGIKEHPLNLEDVLGFLDLHRGKGEHIFLSNDDLCRYFLPSGKFSKEFSNILQSKVIEQIKGYTFERKGGPIGAGEVIF